MYQVINVQFTVKLLNPNFFTVPGSSPQELRSVEVTSRSAELTWDPPPYEDQNGVIISYLISVTVNETGETFVLATNDTSLSITGLRPYRTYICTIAASTSVGVGPNSTGVIVQTLEDSECLVIKVWSYSLRVFNTYHAQEMV